MLTRLVLLIRVWGQELLQVLMLFFPIKGLPERNLPAKSN